jgi:hypothetical protein
MRYFLLLCLCYAGTLQAQNHDLNLEKYWKYRQRLTTEFLVKGEGQGMSMPAEQRNEVDSFVKWGDNTIWLGWYIGVLATELHLLSDPAYQGYHPDAAAKVDSTVEELYYAIHGLQRLDSFAEVSFPSPCVDTAGIYNGFFVRDDVPATFYNNFQGMTTAYSDYQDGYANEMSQDQVYHVLLGLALVKKLVPAWAQHNGLELNLDSRTTAFGIVNWMKQDGWRIKNPVCFDSNGDPKPVGRGPDAYFFSEGTNKVMQFISDGTVNLDADVTQLYRTAWGTLNQPNNPAFTNVDNLHMVMATAAAGKGWGNSTMDNLMDLADLQKWYLYPLLHAVLYDTSSISNYQTLKPELYLWVDSMLNEAPEQGPYTTYPNTNTHGYSVNNRFIRPRSNHYIGSSENIQYNGLDYMLLYNLRQIANKEGWPVDTSTGIQPIAKKTITISPNPANDYIRIQGATDLRIYNMQGIEVKMPMQTIGQDMLKADISGLPAGIYCVMSDKGKGRFIKQ